MCFTICKTKKVVCWSTAMLSYALTKQRLHRDETVGWGNIVFSNIPQILSCCWVALPHARKTRLTRDACIIQKTFHVSKQIWNISIRQIKTFKSYPAFDLSYIKRWPKWWLKPSEITLSKKKHSQKCHVTRLTIKLMHIKQFTEAFQWDGKILAPRAYGGGVGGGWTSFIKP